MKENPMIDVFDVSSDFNPDMILSNVFLDPSLDFMTSIDDADIMAQDFLHFATASGSSGIGSAMFYPTEQNQPNQQQQVEQQQQMQQQIQMPQQQQMQLPQNQQQQQQQFAIISPQKCVVEQQKPCEGRYDVPVASGSSDYAKQAVVPQVANVAAVAPVEPTKSQPAPVQQTCKCEFCEYLQANRISLGGVDHVFQCEFCGEGFGSQSSFNRHRCGSTDIQVYRCEICRREYGTSRTEPSVGVGLLEGARAKCDICNRNYVQSTAASSATTSTTLYGQVGRPALAEANSYGKTTTSVVDSPMEGIEEPFGADSECISELLTEGTPTVEPLPKTFYVLGNSEMTAIATGGGSYLQNAKISSESGVTSLHQYEQYEDEDYSSMSEDEAIVPIEPYAKSPNQEQAKTELPIQETLVDTSSNVVIPTFPTFNAGEILPAMTQSSPTDEECDSSSKEPESTQPTQNGTSPERPFKCHICERSYRNHKNLKAHIKGAHEGIRANQCEICGKNFSGSSYLVIHRRRHTGERPFKCGTCGKAFVDSRALSVHARLHTPGNRLKCMKCEKTFSSASALTVHNRLHTGVHPYKCEICEKTFPQYNNLKHHMKKHEAPTTTTPNVPVIVATSENSRTSTTSTLESIASPSSSNSSTSSSSSTSSGISSGSSSSSSTTVLDYKCNVCSKTFGSSEDLQSHLNQHCKDRPNQCEFCSKVFPRSSHLIIHRRRHTGERPFKCKYCEKAFVDSRALSVHTRLHTGERVTCDICLKTFASSSGLIVHRRIHLGIHPYKCDYCPKSFAQSTALKYHLKKHDTANLPTTTNDESKHSDSSQHSEQSDQLETTSTTEIDQSETGGQVKCQVCNKFFRSAEYLARHRRTHSGERPFQCEICGKNFSTMSYLVIHRRRHTSERPYKCPAGGCPKAFVDSRALQEHSRSVHAKIRVPCETCSKTYSSVSNLIVHRRIHSGVHPFECEHCGRSFAQKNALKYHLKQHGGNDQKESPEGGPQHQTSIPE